MLQVGAIPPFSRMSSDGWSGKTKKGASQTIQILQLYVYNVFRTALVAMHDVSGGDLQDPLTNRILRLAAYRQYTYWVHKRLGKGVRRVIPACVILKVREAYPEESGQYVGYRDACESETDDAWPV
ncbi:PREDICTED: uncharacterized protein LOC106808979 [Priapulus caudatus]|uniref:Uncharacterized protein LOC106808979 n=1 Tax=Priapulus caudatus TaxID=37621 RepID=A0ABM1E5D2_PRICU|nr:PREDICTED: uncharacterized protein LOC106808979 [Priapulus caudatus]